MNLADLFSGGEDSAAADTLKSQLANVNAVQTPTAAQLTLPQLQQYVVAGIMTPEEAQAYLQGQSAFATTTADNTGMDTELSTIGQLQDIVNSGGNDAEEQADIQGILNTLGTTESGNNAAIDRSLSAQGIDNSGLKLAEKLSENSTDATTANSNALQSNAAAEARALAALGQEGTLGGQVQGQQYTQTANAASAADAIAKFNAQQNQTVENLNTTEANAAKAANLANAQDVSNKNTVTAQTQEESVPAAQQQAYQDALNKAAAGVTGANDLANTETQTGQQNAGILGGLISTAGTVASAEAGGNPYTSLASALANNNTGTVPNANVSTSGSTGGVATAATGGRIVPGGVSRPMNMTRGGPIPGKATVPGDSPRNDTQLIAASPDEVMLPRTAAIPAMKGNMQPAMDFLRSLPRPQAKPAIHPKAVLDTMRALNAHHQGVA
jgi:hypothetical protein